VNLLTPPKVFTVHPGYRAILPVPVPWPDPSQGQGCPSNEPQAGTLFSMFR